MAKRRTIGVVALAILAALVFLLARDGAVDRPNAGERVAEGRVEETEPTPLEPARVAAETAPGAAPTPSTPGPAPPAGAATGSIRVRVEDSREESPVAGAGLTFWAGGAYRSGTTDASGEAVFPEVPGPRGSVLVTATERADNRVEFLVERGQESLVVVPLRRLRLLHGVVRSAADGRHVAGATVAVVSHHPLSARPEGAPRESSADGRFSLPEPADGGAIPIRVLADGFVPATVEFRGTPSSEAASATPVEIDPAGRIRGTVRDPEGRPLEGVVVRVHAHSAGITTWTSSGMHGLRSPTAAEIRTDASGSFLAEPVERGGLFVVVASNDERDGPRASAEVFVPWDGDGLAGELVLGRTGRLRVKWTTGSATGLRASIDVTTADLRSSPLASVLSTGSSHDFESLPPGPVSVRIRVGALQGEAEAVVVAGEMAEVEVALANPAAIEGVVRDDAGNPVPRVFVVATPALTPPTPESRAGVFVDLLSAGGGSANSDAEGRFRIDGLADGTRYWLTSSRGPPSVEATAPASGVIVAVPVTGTIAGRLILPTGVLEPSHWTLLLEPEGRPPVAYSPPWEGGRFRFAGAPVGSVRVAAIAGEAALRARDVQIPQDGRLDLGDLPMEVVPQARGAVRDAGGSSVVGAWVAVKGPVHLGISTRTGEAGGFSLGGLPAGTWEVEVTENADEVRSRHSLVVGPEGCDAVLVHRRGGLLRGTAKDPRGVPLAGAWVEAIPAGEGEKKVDGVDHMGRFSVRVAAGEYRVEVRVRDALLAEGRVKVPEGGEAVLELRGER